MSASESLTGAPPWAITCWVDDGHVFTEVPVPNQSPLIQKYPLTEGGLSKALAFLKVEFHKHQPQGGYYKVPEPTVRPGTKLAPKINVSERARESTRAILKRLGLT